MFDSTDFRCEVFKDYNIPFDEKGSSCGVVRKVQWIKGDGERDESKAKIEIRRLYVTDKGERMAKGFSFVTPEGPGELAVNLLKVGFGETKDALNVLRKRADFRTAIETIDDNTDGTDGEMFDMRDLLLSIEEQEEADYA